MDDVTKNNQAIVNSTQTIEAAPIAKEYLIKGTNLEHEFNLGAGTINVLHKMSFNIPKQGFTIIYGPSGSGKSTLMNVIAGLRPPTKGSLVIDNQSLYDLSADGRAHFRAVNMGIVYQTNYWVKSLNVKENVALPLMLSGMSRAAATKQALISLEKVSMGEHANTRPTVLSGGEQQRISMARAMVANPKIILADEPTGNLDSNNGQLIMDLLGAINRELHCTIILITHNLDYLPLSTQQLYIKDGTLTVHDGVYELPKSIIDSAKLSMAALDEGGNNDSKA